MFKVIQAKKEYKHERPEHEYSEDGNDEEKFSINNTYINTTCSIFLKFKFPIDRINA